jgi:hypothetical protein
MWERLWVILAEDDWDQIVYVYGVFVISGNSGFDPEGQRTGICRTSAFTKSGHSKRGKSVYTTVCFRPLADIVDFCGMAANTASAWRAYCQFNGH